jgi:hypothetical protein
LRDRYLHPIDPFAPLAYTFKGEIYCPECAGNLFDTDSRGFIANTDCDGNEVGVIAPWDEWAVTERELLVCGILACGLVIATYPRVID